MTYRPLPDAWSKLIHSEIRKGHAIEELVFIEQGDGSLKPFGPGAPNLGRKEGHCVIVEGVGTRPNGEHYVDFVFATSTDRMAN